VDRPSRACSPRRNRIALAAGAALKSPASTGGIGELPADRDRANSSTITACRSRTPAPSGAEARCTLNTSSPAVRACSTDLGRASPPGSGSAWLTTIGHRLITALPVSPPVPAGNPVNATCQVPGSAAASRLAIVGAQPPGHSISCRQTTCGAVTSIQDAISASRACSGGRYQAFSVMTRTTPAGLGCFTPAG
jgi:hypothetical protein